MAKRSKRPAGPAKPTPSEWKPGDVGFPPERRGRQKDHTVPPPEFSCEGCGATRPREEFTRYLDAVAAHLVLEDEEGDGQIEAPPEKLCDYCATYGPPLENPLARLSKPEIDALAVLAAGGSMRRAGAVMGISERQIRSYLSGREKNMLRAAYAKLLLQIGVTPQKLARVFNEALDATKAQWNSDAHCWDEFPDHSTRVRAAQAAQRILSLEQPAELADRVTTDRGIGVHFHTNLGDGKTPPVEEGYSIEVRPIQPMKQIN